MNQANNIFKTATLLLCFILPTTNDASAAMFDPVRGVVKSAHEAVLSVDLNARVVETPVKTGETFAKGDLLLKFDCDVQNAEARAAKAEYQASKSTHSSNVQLQQYGAIGEFDVNVSEAEMQRAQAQVDATTGRTKDCEIHAPFDGKVAELRINVFETPAPSQPLLKIVGNDANEVHLIVPSTWLAWLRNGSNFEFEVDETGIRHQAEVRRFGAEVDAVSRTVPVVAEFTTRPAPVLPGMSGTAYFEEPVNHSASN